MRWLNVLLGRRGGRAEPEVSHEPDFAVTEVDGRWYLALYTEHADLWAEEFTGPRWAWRQWKRDVFPTREAAEKFGRERIDAFRAEQAAKRAKRVFAASLPTGPAA